MHIEYKNTFGTAFDFITYSLIRNRGYLLFSLAFAAWIGYTTFRDVAPEESLANTLFVTTAMMGLAVAALYLAEIVFESVRMLFNRRFFLPRSLEVNDQGIITRSPGIISEMRWDTLDRIGQTRKNILFYTTRTCAITLPKQAFANSEAENDFLQLAHMKMAAARAAANS